MISGSDGHGCEDIEDSLPVKSESFPREDAFDEAYHREGDEVIVHELHRLPGPGPSHILKIGSHTLEYGPYFLDYFLISSDKYRELSRNGFRSTARHGGIDEVDSLFSEFISNPLRPLDPDGRHIDEYTSRLYGIFMLYDHIIDCLTIRKHGDDDIRREGLLESHCLYCSKIGKFFGFSRRTIIDRECVSLRDDVSSHRYSHEAESEERKSMSKWFHG